MPKVRQVPKLYLRGSLATVTMTNLNETQRTHINDVVLHVANHPEMTKYKHKVIQEYGITIAADFKDNRNDAEAEYQIAIWRGVVDLFYHNKYDFKCKACNSSTYLTKRGKSKPIDRMKIPCPNCEKIEVNDPGDTELIKGSYITHLEFQNSYINLHDGCHQPTYKSTIEPQIVEKKYNNPQEIIDDPKQLKKFFGEYVWNYFRQQLAENCRQITTATNKIEGPADQIIVEEICNICRKLGIGYNYCEKSEPNRGKYTIKINGLTTTPEFSIEFAAIMKRAQDYEVAVTYDHNNVYVWVNLSAPNLETLITKPEYINIIEEQISIDDGLGTIMDQLPNRSSIMDIEDDSNSMVDSSDMLLTIRKSLPEPVKETYDILCQQGEAYRRYESQYGTGDPKINTIAEFLQIPSRTITDHRNIIRNHCLYHDFTTTLSRNTA